MQNEWSIEQSLTDFFVSSFKILKPSDDYIHNWHLDLISEYLIACANGEIRRLNINIPPRCTKTRLVSEAFPMWVMGNDPTKSFIGCSYSADLSIEMNNNCRNIARSDWFKKNFPKFCITKTKLIEEKGLHIKNTSKEFITSAGGGRYATSYDATLTGKGADFIIIDDLINPREASSDIQRKNHIDWCRQTLFSRLNNPAKGCIINVQQRLHVKDIVGELTDDTWTHVVIPAKFDKKTIYSFGNVYKVCEQGELLEKNRLSEQVLIEKKKEMGTFFFETQYMQKPAPAEGSIIKADWLVYYLFKPTMEFRCIYADTAMKEGQENDYTVFQCWGKYRGHIYLLDSVKGQWTTPDVVKKAKLFWDKHYANKDDGCLRKFAIEDKLSGTCVIQMLKEEAGFPVTLLTPKKDKVARTQDVTPRIEAGLVHIPEKESFTDDLVQELLFFPYGEHDDQVDTLTYAILDLLSRDENSVDYSVLVGKSWL